MADKFVCRLYFPSEKLSSQDVINTFFDYTFFTASHMKGIGRSFNSVKYKQRVFLEGLEKKLISNESRYTIVLEDEMINSSMGLYKRSNSISMFTITIAESSFAEYRTEILSNIDLQFQKLSGIVCYANSMIDSLLQNSQNPDTYIRNNKSLDNIKLIPSPGIKDQLIIDIEQFPGHSHLVNDLWFGTGWKMWFGSHYFQHIPRDLLVSFNNCYEKNELGNGMLSITLFKDIWDYDNPENRAKQWSFRRYTGIDEIAHALMKSRQSDIHDPSISIETEMACKHGGVRLITYYYNDNGDLVQRTKATRCKIYEFGADGQVIYSNEEILKDITTGL